MPVETPWRKCTRQPDRCSFASQDILSFCRVLLWQQPVHVADALSGKWRDDWIGSMGYVLAKRGNACGRRCGMNRAVVEASVSEQVSRSIVVDRGHGTMGVAGEPEHPAEGLGLTRVTVSTQVPLQRGRPWCRHGPQEGAWDGWRRRSLQTVHGGTRPAAAADLWRHAPLGWRGCPSAGRDADAGLRAWGVRCLAGPPATGHRRPGPPRRADEASGPPPRAPSAGD
jgi:hypothetical protein